MPTQKREEDKKDLEEEIDELEEETMSLQRYWYQLPE